MLRPISLFVVLMATWLLLSGHYEPLIIVFGVLSCAAVTMIAFRMKIIDIESHPVHLWWRAPIYWIWLGWEVVKSNFHVMARILQPGPPISPRVFKVKATQSTDLGRVLFANSITLTPGTVALRVDEDSIEVHALTREAADGLRDGTMDRKVSSVEYVAREKS